jgi:hypothetical protein
VEGEDWKAKSLEQKMQEACPQKVIILEMFKFV